MQRSPIRAGQTERAERAERAAWAGQSGFTLIELIVVMIIIGVMGYVALPRFSSMMGFADIGYRDQVAAAIDYARKIAVAQRRHTCVIIAAGSVTVKIDTGLPSNHVTGNCPTALALPAGSSVISAPSGMSVSPAVNIDFDAEGRPVSGAPATLTFTGAGGASSLTIEAESGYVH
ncbi:General secretion pathway protein H [Sterolibacterium denitrificans]|uniref:Type II secretion system protein H n=1 Tax=Sterolibacterium denitrificans TaxID=157592 RepID=A0A7Z7MUW0_9PROT|nr:type II secretion system protein [Sterolibacterium denitrificans]SMB24360.1 General secretion pathway protein H [Sterolibacterium denitrificans]